MFCTNCGNKITEGADVCVHCGKLLKNAPQTNVPPKKHSGFAVAALVLGIIAAFFGFCCLVTIDESINAMLVFDVMAGRVGFIIGYVLIPMILSIISFIFSLLDFRKGKNGFNIAGLILSIATFVIEGLQVAILMVNM